MQVCGRQLVIAYATFGHSRPSGHLVFHDVAYKDRTRRRFFSGNSMRGGSKWMFSGTYLDTTQSFVCILFASWRLQRQQVMNILSFAKRNAASGLNGKLYTNSYLWRTALTCMSWCKHVYRYQPEAVFGQIKYDNSFKRFHYRGRRLVKAESAVAHNIRKMISNGYVMPLHM